MCGRVAGTCYGIGRARHMAGTPIKPDQGEPMFERTATLLVAACAALVFGSLPAAAPKQTLHMAYWAGPSHQLVQTLAAWIKTIEDASGGNLTVELDKAALGKMDAQYDLIRNGVRDLGCAVPGYTVGRFDLLQGAELPLLCANPATCSPVAWK